MKRNAINAALGIVAVALLVIAVLQQREIRTLNQKLADSLRVAGDLRKASQEAVQRLREQQEREQALAVQDQARLEESNSRAQAEIDRQKQQAAEQKAGYEKRIAELTAGERQAPTPPPPPEPPAATPPAKADQATTAPTASQAFQQMAKMMKNPAMKGMVRGQQKTLIDMTYKSLFDSLSLNGDQLDKLKELLLDKQMNLMDVGLEMMDGSLTPEQRKTTAARLEALNAESEKAIRDLLGDTDFEWYKTYEETKQERMHLNMFSQSLGDANPLTTEQEEALATAMYEARSGFKSLNDMQNPGALNPGQFSPERIDQLIADLRRLNEQYAARAAQILNPEQLRQFRTFLDQQQAMQEMGMRMAGRMFGNETSPTPPPAAPLPPQ